jgi:hypothetical protein
LSGVVTSGGGAEPLEEAVDVGGGVPAQPCLFITGKDGGEIRRLGALRPVPHAVDASILAEQGPASDTNADLSGRDARAQQLRARHNAVRAHREPPDHPFCGRLGAHIAP